MIRRVRLLLLILFFGSALKAQTQIEVEKFTTSEGLSNNIVYRTHKDQYGFLWLATRDGLNRFDGKDFKVFRYRADDSLSICGNTVYYIDEDTQGNLWIMTSTGLCKYIRSKNNFLRFNFPWIDALEKQYSLEPSLMIVNDQVWFTDYEGINAMDARTHRVRRYRLQDPYQGRHLISLGKGPEGKIYAGSLEGLFVLNEKAGVFEKKNEPFPEAAPLSFYTDSKKTFWVTMWAQGALNLSGNPPKLVRYGKYESLFRVFETAPDSFVACGDFQGLLSFSRNDQALRRVTIINKKTGLPENFIIYSIASYDKDFVWFSGSDGLLRWDRRPTHVTKVFLDSSWASRPLKISSVVGDPVNSDEIWVNIWYQNLVRYNLKSGKTNNYFSKDKKPLRSLPWGYYHVLLADRDGSVWITGQYGVWKYDRNTDDFTKLTRGSGLQNLLDQPCNKIIKLSNGNYLTNVMSKGFVEFSKDLKIYKEYLFDFSDLHGRDLSVSSMVESSGGTVLFCSSKSGLFSLNLKTGKIRRITEDGEGNGIPANLTSLEKDNNGHIWVGALEHIIVFDSAFSIIKLHSTQNGLVSNNFHNIFKDSRNNMWVATRIGLSILEPGNSEFNSLTQDNGLVQSNSHALSELQTGQIVVSHYNGLSILQSDQIKAKDDSLPLRFTEIKVQDREYALYSGTPLIISSGENPLTVRFAVVNVNDPPGATFSYQLKGTSGSWVPLGTSNTISLYELQPGDYSLMVKANLASGSFGGQPIKLDFTVLPPFYGTWWFRVMIVVLTGSLIYMYFRSRLQRQRELESIRARISRDLHDDIGSTLSSINMLTRSATRRLNENDSKGFMESLEKIGERTGRLLDNMNDIIWSVKPENDSLENVLSRMREYASTTLEAKRISFDIVFPVTTGNESLSLDVKNSLYMIFKEALNNCVKYSECTYVRISLEYRNGYLDFSISDNGIGFDQESTASIPGFFGGNGLHNMRKRAQEAGGLLYIRSEPGKGTEVQFIKGVK